LGRIEAVVFDIGNVLIEWQPERFYDREVGEARRRALFAEVDLGAMNLRVDLGEDLRQVVEETAARHPDQADLIRLWHDRWIDLASPAIPQSVRLLEALSARGVKLFALTNFGTGTFRAARQAYPFLDRFDRAFVSGELRLLKPDPAIYHVVEAEGGVAPGALFFTDDRPENVAAAALRGWQTHLFDGPGGLAARLVAEGLLTEEEAR
jgi:2-haloacid dehalogenase